MMFEMIWTAGLALAIGLLLFVWADVRKIGRELKTYRRDLMRNSLGGRTSDHYAGFSEEDYWKEAREEQEKERQQEVKPEIQQEPVKEDKRKVLTLKPGEEQVLREILLEFLN